MMDPKSISDQELFQATAEVNSPPAKAPPLSEYVSARLDMPEL